MTTPLTPHATIGGGPFCPTCGRDHPACEPTHAVRMTREMARRFLLFLAANGGVESHADYVSIDDLWLALGED